MKYIKSFFKFIYRELKSIISINGIIQTNLVIVFFAFYFFIWTFKMAMANRITINNLYELIFYSENFLLIIICLLFNAIYKSETLQKITTNIIENKLNTDIDGDNEIGGKK